MNKPNVTFNRPFHIVNRVIWNLRWVDNADQFFVAEFMDAGAALTNGIGIRYNDIDMLSPTLLISNGSFGKFAYDTNLLLDDKAAPLTNYVLQSRFSFNKFIDGGINVSGKNTLYFYSDDDLSSIGISIGVTLEGWGLY